MNKEIFWRCVYWVALLGAIVTFLIISLNKKKGTEVKKNETIGVEVTDLFDYSYAGWVYFGRGNDSVYVYKKKSYNLVIKDTIYLHDTVFIKK